MTATPFTVTADCDLGAGAAPWVRESGADVAIARAQVPDALPNGAAGGLAWQHAENRVLIVVPCGIRFLVEGGETIRYSVADGVGAADLRLFLLGTAWPVLAMQRDLLPLHASAVAHGANVHAFAGVSAAGKSTLAAALAGRGFPFFADDVVLFDPMHVGRAGDETACYRYEDLKLWPRGLDLARVRAEGPVREVDDYDKRYATPPQRSQRVGGALRTLRTLEASYAPGRPLRDEPLHGRRAFQAVYNVVHRRPYALVIVGRARLFDWLTRLASHVEVFTFHRATAPARFDEGVAALSRTLSTPDQ